jgi:hypothetical protein
MIPVLIPNLEFSMRSFLSVAMIGVVLILSQSAAPTAFA